MEHNQQIPTQQIQVLVSTRIRSLQEHFYLTSFLYKKALDAAEWAAVEEIESDKNFVILSVKITHMGL